MNTPIYDFVQKYAKTDFSRFHMPGHKGHNFIGCEKYDITEIDGADVLYMSDGIIKESEKNATDVFRTAKTFFSTEGSSHCIRAMLGAVACHEPTPLILAARNVHKAFVYACATLDINVEWIYPNKFTHLCSCIITANDVEIAIKKCSRLPNAVYITSPDYLGNIADIFEIGKICEKYGILLLVDNAHGAYLGFLESDCHPIHIGAHICCDSAHKTLPVLTGGAYLHFSDICPGKYIDAAERMLRIFASTSPSYLTLQSLDLCNKYLAEEFSEKLIKVTDLAEKVRRQITQMGFKVENSEPLKIVINIWEAGYKGVDFAEILTKSKIIPEFYDDEFVVFMISTETDEQDMERLTEVFRGITVKPLLKTRSRDSFDCIKIEKHDRVTMRAAVFSEQENLPIEMCVGRICGTPTVSCPPAIPLVISGEIITENDIDIMKKYGIQNIDVVKKEYKNSI